VALAGFVVTEIEVMQDSVPIGERWINVEISYDLQRVLKIRLANAVQRYECSPPLKNLMSAAVDSPVAVNPIGLTLRGYYETVSNHSNNGAST
jgi:hypothetical protein